MKDTGGPYLAMAVLCEKVLEERDGAMSFIRVVDTWTFSPGGHHAPADFPGQRIEFFLVVTLKPGKASGRSTLSIDLEKPSGEFGKKSEIPVLFDGEDVGVSTIAKVSINVEQAGLYWFHVLLKDQLLTKVPLRIVYRPLQGPGQSTP